VTVGTSSKVVQILYLEDDPLDVAPVEDRLIRTGLDYQLTLASDRKQFEQAMQNTSFDLILADYLLPSYDGMRALAYARTRDPDLPFILISGVLGEEQAVDCVLQGATDYVLKHHLDRLVPATQRALAEAGERKRRRAAEAALTASEERYRGLFENAQEGLWLVDRQRTTLMGNRRLAALLGMDQAALQGASLASCIRDPRALQILERMCSEAPSSNEALELTAANGDALHIIVSKSELRDVDGEFNGVMLRLTDVTERRAAEEVREQLRAQIERANRMESLAVMVGGVAHDMNNILTAILGVASLHLGSDDAARERDFTTICNAAERGSEMLQRMLKETRPSSPPEQLIDVNGLVKEVVTLLERSTLSGIHIVLQLAADLPPVRGDASALNQTLMNLCVNAADAMKNGGTLTICTSTEDDEWVQLEVRDDGEGMSDAVLASTQRPFVTTKVHGTGLGLAIVRRAVEAHLGTFEIDSAPGQGTTVTLRFPSPSRFREAPSNDASPPSASGAAPLAFVVESNEVVRSAVRQLLKQLGHRARALACVDDVLSALDGGERPDLTVLDAALPAGESVEVIRALRRVNRAMPVLLTASGDIVNARRLAGSDPNAHLLEKPFTVHRLREALESAGVATSDQGTLGLRRGTR